MQVRLVPEYKAILEKGQKLVQDGKMNDIWIDHYSTKIKANINGEIKTLACDEDLEELVEDDEDENLDAPPNYYD